MLQVHVHGSTGCPGTVYCALCDIIRGEAFVNRFASFSASASAPMDPNLRIHQLQPTATCSSPVREKAHHSYPGLLAQESLYVSNINWVTAIVVSQ